LVGVEGDALLSGHARTLPAPSLVDKPALVVYCRLLGEFGRNLDRGFAVLSGRLWALTRRA